jgi:uncharacterized membrane protein
MFNYAKQLFAAITLGLASLFMTAYAAVPAGVDTAITAAQTDAVTVGGYIIAAVAALVGIVWMIRMLRRG